MRCLVTALFLCVGAQIAVAQSDLLALYGDESGSTCELSDVSPGIKTVYVIHEASAPAAAVSFRIVGTSGSGLSYISEAVPFEAVLGDVQSGISVAYGGCMTPSVLVASVSYFGAGTSAPCSFLRVKRHPQGLNDFIEVVDCVNSYRKALGQRLVINPDGSCECGADGDRANWGEVKAKFD